MRLLKEFLFRYFIKRLNYFGVSYDNDLPPEFILTKHAWIRVQERMNLKSSDTPLAKKILLDAWYEGLDVGYVPPQESNQKKGFSRSTRVIYKNYNGHYFVFATIFNHRINARQKHLITVLYGEELKKYHYSSNSVRLVTN